MPIADIICLSDVHLAGGFGKLRQVSRRKFKRIGGLLVDVAVLYDRLVFFGDIKPAI